MATFNAGFKFPEVDFDWLGQLPAISEEAGKRRARKEALSDLQSTSPEELEGRAARLMGIDPELGLKLHDAALRRRELGRKQAADTAYERALPGILDMLRRGGFTPGGGAAAPGAPAAAATFGAPAPAPDPWSGPQGLPPGVGPQSMGPSDALLARAEGQLPPGLPQTRLAGPPVPQGGQQPAWMQGAQQRMPPAQPQAPSQAAPQAGLSPEQSAWADVERIGSMMLRLPKGSPPSAFAAFRGPYDEAIRRARPSQDQKDYAHENFERIQQGLPPFRTLSEYQLQKQVAPDEFKAGLKVYTSRQDEANKARELEGSVNRLSAIVNHPKFESGQGTAFWNYGKGLIRNLKDTLEAEGVPLPPGISQAIDSATSSVQLREAFTAISNSAIFNKLGGLGNQISEGDRKFVEVSFPSLLLSKEGNKLVLEYYKHVIEKNKELGKIFRDEYKKRGANLKSVDLDDIADKYFSDPKNSLLQRPDGTLTEFGQRMRALDTGGPSPPAQGAPQAAPPAAAPKGPPGRPVQGPDGKRYWEIGPGQLVPQEDFL